MSCTTVSVRSISESATETEATLNARFLRSLLVLAGAYWIAEWLASVIMTGEAALGIGYSGVGRLGELWIDVRQASPRTLAAAGGTALLWLALGSTATRRWMWGLAGLFAVFGLVNRQFHPAAGVVPDPVSRVMDVAVYCGLPTLGCVVAVWLLGRFAPAAGDVGSVSDPIGISTRARSRALLVVGSILMLLVGAFVGMWITSTVQIQQMSGWMVAAIDSARRSQYAFAQYREANYEEAKSALEQFAAYLESQKPASREWQPGEAPLSDEKALAFDRMLTYARLALRAERANRADEATNYWQRAEQHAEELKWEQPRRDRIRSTITRLDTEPSATSTASPR
jgi:hypothetical protein